MGIDRAHFIFDWCQWEWEIEGNYGVWDDDFRYEIYSLGISSWATADIHVVVNFETTATDPMKNFFKDCVSLANRIKEVAHAIKTEIDANRRGVVPAAQPSDFHLLNATTTRSDFCSRRAGDFEDSFGNGLDVATILCFHAVRPRPENGEILNYTVGTGTIYNQTYHLSTVCLRGRTELQDWLSVIKGDTSLSQDLSTEVQSFEFGILVFLILFLPLVILKIFPWGEEVSYGYGNGCINVLKEETKFIMNEKKRRLQREHDGLEYTNSYSHRVFDANQHTINERKAVQFSVIAEKKGKGVFTFAKSKDEQEASLKSFLNKLLTFALDEWDQLSWNWEMKKEKQNDGTQNKDLKEVDETIQKQYMYVPLNTSTPPLLLFSSFFSGKSPVWMTPTMIAIQSTIRRGLLILLGSTNAIILMMILDAVIFDDHISRLIQFRNRHQVEINDLGYWNYFSTVHPIRPLENDESIRYDILYIAIAVYWILSVFVYALPGVTSYCMKCLYPSSCFGFFNVVQVQKRHMFGLRLIYEGLLQRMGFVFDVAFWQRFFRQVFEKKNGKLSALNILKGFISLICVFSTFPVIAMFPPLYSWNKKYWPKVAAFFILTAPSFTILLVLIVLTLKIYLRFFLFTITALIFHYQVTIGVVSIGIGSLGFVISLRSQIQNAYLQDKLQILAVITEVHNELILENEKRVKLLERNEQDPCHKIHVPELTFFWRQEAWSCIPKRLYQTLVQRLRPLGRQRTIIYIKILVMAIFAGFIYTVMKTMGMSNNNSGFDAIRMIITVLAVTVPTFIAKLRSSEAKAVLTTQRKGIIRQEVEWFLEEHKSFYNYDLEGLCNGVVGKDDDHEHDRDEGTVEVENPPPNDFIISVVSKADPISLGSFVPST